VKGETTVDNKKYLVRLLTVELNGFKNCLHGSFKMPNMLNDNHHSADSEVLGIYGQNGSGKTAVLDALTILQYIFRGQTIPNNTAHYICYICNEMSLDFSFYICVGENEYIIYYKIVFGRSIEEHAVIKSESLSYSIIENSVRKNKVGLVLYDENDDASAFRPSTKYNELLRIDRDNELNIRLARLLAEKDHKSFIFSDEFHAAWEKTGEDSQWNHIIHTLHNYSYRDFFVFISSDRWPISANAAIPFTYQFGEYIGNIVVLLNEPTVHSEDDFNMFESLLSNMNTVIESIVPGLSIEIENHGKQLTKEGKDGIRFELVSVRGGMRIPLRYESEGIKRVLSILNIIISAYNNPSMLIAIDELDAGIFEYLLGQILLVFSETGKGQLIFTSHNLRPLEMIDKKSIILTTTNPENRYVRPSNIKTTNNLRDVYLRSITVGGQKEELYDETESSKIRMAMRKAGTQSNV
jgi:AAA15 family ATPase/GTPase